MSYKIELISMKNSGIKFFDDKWRTVTGKAAELLAQFQKGDVVSAQLDERGNVTYIGFAKEGEIAEATDATTNQIKDVMGDLFDALSDISSQMKQISMRMKRIEENLGIKDEPENFKRASD